MPYGLHYSLNLTALLFQRKIKLVTYRRAMRERPIAVCGKGGAYIVDPKFDEASREGQGKP